MAQNNPFDQFDAPASSNPFDQFDQGASPAKPAKEMGFGETLLNSARRGIPALMGKVTAANVVDKAEGLQQLDRIDQLLAEGKSPKEIAAAVPLGALGEGYLFASPEARARLREQATPAMQSSMAEGVAKTVRLNQERNAIPLPDVVEKVSGAKTWGEALSEFNKDKLKFIASVGPESAIQSLPGMVASVPAGMGAGPAGVAAAMGADSALTSYSQGLVEALSQRGVDTNNPEAIKQALKDPKMLAEIQSQAGRYAAVVGGFDALSGGLAGKTLLPKSVAAKLGNRPLTKELANIAVQVPVQGALGGAGEAGGQLASGQEVKPGEVLAEIAGEAFSAPGDIAAASAGRVRDAMRSKAPADPAAAPVDPTTPAQPEAQPQAPVAQPAATPATPSAPAAPAVDPLQADAVALVQGLGKPSVPAIQRHFRIGFNRANALLEQMERDGIVSPMNEQGGRTLLVKPAAPEAQPDAQAPVAGTEAQAPQAPADQTPAAVGGDAAGAPDAGTLPGAGSPEVEAAGLNTPQSGVEAAPIMGDAPQMAAPEAPAAPPAPAPTTGTNANGQDVNLQNRNRGSAASVAQMSAIARNPDYLRLGPSRTPDSGAPMVFAVGNDLNRIAVDAFGREDVAVMSDGQRVPFRYAVVDANSLEPSHFADGRTNPAFSQNVNGTLKALNNGRTAGLRAAHELGTAGQYLQDLTADAAQHGIDPAVIERTPNPVLVRVYDEASNTKGMAAKSQGQGEALSVTEQAATDAPLIDRGLLEQYRGGALDLMQNAGFVRGFIQRLQDEGQPIGKMMGAGGQLSADGLTRLKAAMMQVAYGDPALVDAMFESLDPNIKAIGGALREVAGEWAVMRAKAADGSIPADTDVTGNLVQALRLIQDARNKGQAIYDLARQTDMLTGEAPDELTLRLLGLFFSGNYFTRPVAQSTIQQRLTTYLEAASVATGEADMFGQVVGRDDILNTILGKDSLEAAPEPERAPAPESQGQPERGGPAGDAPAADRQPRGGRKPKGEGSKPAQDRPSRPGRQDGQVPSGNQEGSQGDRPAAGPKVSANTVFTEDAAQAARERLKAKLAAKKQADTKGQRGALDPEEFADGVTLAGYHIEKGARTFAAYVQAMLADLGDAVKPYLKSWYMGVKFDPRGAILDGMDSAASVEAADVDALAQASQENRNDDERTDANPEPAGPDGQQPQLEAPAGNADGQAPAGDGQGVQRDGGQGGGRPRGLGADRPAAPADGERGNQQDGAEDGRPATAGSAARGDDTRGTAAPDGARPDVQPGADEASAPAPEQAAPALTFAEKLAAQQAAESIGIKVADAKNIRDTLPMLSPGQQDDVLFAEKRLTKPDGYGVLFTNGTGTGKTYTGLGIIKRMHRQGKRNGLLVVPSEKLVNDWVAAAKNLGLTITPLKDTNDAGTGIAITTYANAGANNAIAKRDVDFVLADEAHSLMQNADAESTAALKAVRALTLHPDGAYERYERQNAEDIAKLAAMNEQYEANSRLRNRDDTMDEMRDALAREMAALEAKMAPLRDKLAKKRQEQIDRVAASQNEKRPRAVFLSATPFAYEKNIQWAAGYLFQYPEVKDTGRYNQPNPYQQFMVQHFGYRMKNGRLNEPSAEVDRDLMQRNFNTFLRKSGSLSSRVLDVDFDYERRFILVQDGIGQKIDEGMKWLREAENRRYSSLYTQISDQFDSLTRRRLLEAIKAKEAIPFIKAQHALGRKVVVFYDFNQGGGINLFNVQGLLERALKQEQDAYAQANELNRGLLKVPKLGQQPGTKLEEEEVPLSQLLREFMAARPDLQQIDFSKYTSPLATLREAFPNAGVYNGMAEFKKTRLQAIDKFNDDAQPEANLLLVQKAANAGWSGHDTTGKHQRVLINLGLPTEPAVSIQQEGRVYRFGQASDAIFHYFNTGTTWERTAFASTISRRASTVENMGMGEEARGLREAYIQAFENSDPNYVPGPDDGKGGKANDRALVKALTDWDRARALYFAKQKRNSSNKAQEGADYFATPEPVGLKMVQWADIRAGESLLEPSAGDGAIARWFPDKQERTVVEPSLELASRLGLATDAKLVNDRFENFNTVNKFDVIVMNPPFGVGGKTSTEHLAKAIQHLRDNGRIVALLPDGPAANKRLDALLTGSSEVPAKPVATVKVGGKDVAVFEGDTVSGLVAGQPYEGLVTRAEGQVLYVKKPGAPNASGMPWPAIREVKPTGPRTRSVPNAPHVYEVARISLPNGAFERAGTDVKTHIVILDKVTDPQKAKNLGSSTRDLSQVKGIKELFERLEDMELPPRQIATVAQPPAMGEAPKPAPAARAEAVEREQASGFQPAEQGKAYFKEMGGKLETNAPMVTVETKAGKKLQGVFVPDAATAKEVDKFTWRAQGGNGQWFVRMEHVVRPATPGAQSVNEPGASYQNDLFGEPLDLFGQALPAAPAKRAVERPAQPPKGGNVDAAGAVPGDTPTPAGEYFVNTLVGVERTHQLGARQVTSGRELAQAMRHLYRSAVERFDALVTDKDGKPLAIVGGFKGAIASASVQLDTLVGEAVRVPGAANIWFAHNHPSGNPDLSNADRNLYNTLMQVFTGSGIEPKGLIAVSRSAYSFTNAFSDDSDVMPPAGEPVNVPAIERVLDDRRDFAATPVVDSPPTALSLGRKFWAKGGNGVMLLDSQTRLAGWAPLPDDPSKLRETGGLNALYRAFSQSNARSAVLVHDGVLDKQIKNFAVTAGQNVAAALQLAGVQVVDSVNVKTGISEASSVRPIASGPVFSRASLAQAREALVKPTRVVRDERGNPEYEFDGLQIASPMEDLRIDVLPAGDGRKVLQYAVMPANAFEVIGTVDLLVGPDGKPESLLDIVAAERGQGMGAKVIEALLRAYPTLDLNISNIVPDAQLFWEKMGVPVQNREEGAAYDGTLNLQTFLQAQDDRRASGRAGGGQAANRRADARAEEGAFSQVPAGQQGRPRGLTTQALQGLVDRLKPAMPNAPDIVVLGSPSEADIGLRLAIQQAGAFNDIEGALYQGRIYLFGRNLSSLERAEFVLAEHEVAHAGLRMVLGDEQRIKAMRMLADLNPALHKQASAKAKDQELNFAIAVEEVLVDMPTAQLPRLKGWRKFLQMLADGLDRMGLRAAGKALRQVIEAKTDNAELAASLAGDLIRAARDHIKGKAGAKERAQTAADRLESAAVRGQWMDLEAKGRGFKDAAALQAAKPLVHSRLMDLWSRKNPGQFSRADNPTWFSALARELGKAGMNTAPAKGWADTIKGMVQKGLVKQDEVEWTGLGDWLALQDGKVTKAQVLEYLAGNAVQVQEVTLGDALGDSIQRLREQRDTVERELDALGFEMREEYGEPILHKRVNGMDFTWDDGEFVDEDGEPMARTDSKARDLAMRYGRLTDEMENMDGQPNDGSRSKYAQYTLPGGENYREVLLTLPSSDATRRAKLDKINERVNDLPLPRSAEQEAAFQRLVAEHDAIADAPKGSDYRSSHWDQPNIVAHIRLNDRTDAEGKRVLFVEEVQSDWGQEGKKKGFLQFDWRIEKSDDGIFYAWGRDNGEFYGSGRTEAEAIATANAERGAVSNRVPAAPFVTKTEGWLNLALKRIIKMAVDEGYDRVAFVTGEQSAERYSLSTVVEKIDYYTRSGTTMVAIYQEGDTVTNLTVRDGIVGRAHKTPDQFVGKRLDDVLGKEVADRILSDPNDGVLEGDGLKVGGEGMKAFYDSIVPNAAKALLKKLGGGQMGAIMLQGSESRDALAAKVYGRGETYRNLPSELKRKIDAMFDDRAIEQPGFDITTAMRDKVAGGLPLFSRAPEPRMTRSNPQTETPQFKAWFKDSKVVDQDGKPLILYHGTQENIEAFDEGKGDKVDPGWLGRGFYFTSSPDTARYYATNARAATGAANILPVYVSLQNPYMATVRDKEQGALKSFGGKSEWAIARRKELMDQGYDGVILDYSQGGYSKELEVVAFNPTQVKSALGNNGNFDQANPSLVMSRRDTQTQGFEFDAPAPEDFALTAPTRQDVLAQQKAREDEAKIEAAQRRVNEERARKDAERKAIAARMDASAENFQLGQSAEEALSGQGSLFSRAQTVEQRADAIIQQKAARKQRLDKALQTLTRLLGIEFVAGRVYSTGAYLLNRFTPEFVKAGVISDYGLATAIKDRRSALAGRQRNQIRDVGKLTQMLSTLTREESRVAYEWLNGDNQSTAEEMMQALPAESVKVLEQVRELIDTMSQEAVRLKQLSPEAFERNRFAYLHRAYAKHELSQTPEEKRNRAAGVKIVGDQYKGRGITKEAGMAQIKNGAPEWWGRRLEQGKADTSLKGQQFVRLEKRVRPAARGAKATMVDDGTQQMDGFDAPGVKTRIAEVVYIPLGQPIPAKFSEWTNAGVFEVRDVAGEKVEMWRDFTHEERQAMGELDEVRFAIVNTMHGMIHDIEVGKYLEWLAQNYAEKSADDVPGELVPDNEASFAGRAKPLKPGQWVRVPETKIPGTQVLKYGTLAGRFVEGPVWNEIRQVTEGDFRLGGPTWNKLLGLWKLSKTALSPGVHTNNIMANMVMADWHNVQPGHVAKALRVLLAASEQDGKGALGKAGRGLEKVAGIKDTEAAREILNRYRDSGGDVGMWATNELARDQLTPLLEQLEAEVRGLAVPGASQQVGVMAALQLALQRKFPEAYQALKGSKPVKIGGNEASKLIDLYQAEDDVFRLAAWLRAKEEGQSDADAGDAARTSFLDYQINAPWIQAMRSTAWPFISFTYRGLPMLLETAGKKPHKLLKLMLLAGAVNAMGTMLAGGDDDEEDRVRRMLPDEKAGKVWGMVPKLIRMPWNDQHGNPVFLDIRRWIPLGDIADVGQGHAAFGVPPSLMPGGPLAVFGELWANKSAFTGQPITLETDSATEKAGKVMGHLYRTAVPNLPGVPGTYATQGIEDAINGKTDVFGREGSVMQALASSLGVKVGGYAPDVLEANLTMKVKKEADEIMAQVRSAARQEARKGITAEEYKDIEAKQVKKLDALMDEYRGKTEKAR